MDAYYPFSLVIFDQENSIEVVPTGWLDNEVDIKKKTLVSWPTTVRRGLDIENMIKNKAAPGSQGWKKLSAFVIAYHGDYESAERELQERRTPGCSGLDTELSDEERIPQSKGGKGWRLSSSEEDSDNGVEMPVMGGPRKKNRTTVERSKKDNLSEVDADAAVGTRDGPPGPPAQPIPQV